MTDDMPDTRTFSDPAPDELRAEPEDEAIVHATPEQIQEAIEIDKIALPATLDRAVRTLALRRHEHELARQEWNRVLTAFMKASANAELTRRVSEASELARKCDDEVRRLAIRTYELDLSAKPHPAVSIRKEHVMELTVSVDELRAWALQSMPHLVKLDLNDLKKVARPLADSGNPIPGVVFSIVPAAAIASDLTEYLPKEDKP